MSQKAYFWPPEKGKWLIQSLAYRVQNQYMGLLFKGGTYLPTDGRLTVPGPREARGEGDHPSP